MIPWLAAALVLLALLLLPFGGVVEYSADGLLALVRVGPLRWRVYPPGKKKETPKKAKKKQPSPPKKEAEKKPPETKKGGKLAVVQAALPLVRPALAGLRRRLVVDQLELQVVWADSDPAGAAMGYGMANAALGMLWAVIDESFRVKKSRLGCQVDFDGTEPSVYARASLSLNLWKALTLVLPLAIRFFMNTARIQRDQDDTKKKEA